MYKAWAWENPWGCNFRGAPQIFMGFTFRNPTRFSYRRADKTPHVVLAEEGEEYELWNIPDHTLSKGRLSRSEDFNRAFPTFLPLQRPLDKGETSVKITAKSKAHRSLRLSPKIVCSTSPTPYHAPIGSSVRVGKQLKDLQVADSLSREKLRVNGRDQDARGLWGTYNYNKH